MLIVAPLLSIATFRHTPRLSSRVLLAVEMQAGSGCAIRIVPYCTDPYHSVETSHYYNKDNLKPVRTTVNTWVVCDRVSVTVYYFFVT